MVYLDTDVTIYLVERHSVWWPHVVARLSGFRAAGHIPAVSDLTRAECLVGPLKSGDRFREAAFRAFFADPWSGCFR